MNDVVTHIKSLKYLPADVIDAVVGFSATAVPLFMRDRVHQACLDWRGDLERYILEELGADEVLVDVPSERLQLIVPGGAQSNGKGLPFYFRSQLALLPTELERTAPKFAHFIAALDDEGKRDVARAHLERAMAVTCWVLMRLAFEENLHNSLPVIAAVGEDGVDVVWRGRPTVSCAQDMKTFCLVVSGAMVGELVPKRRGTFGVSSALH